MSDYQRLNDKDSIHDYGGTKSEHMKHINVALSATNDAAVISVEEAKQINDETKNDEGTEFVFSGNRGNDRLDPISREIYCILLRLKNFTVNKIKTDSGSDTAPVNLEVMVDEHQQFGVALYHCGTKNELPHIKGFHRILCFSKEELPKTITFKVHNEKRETINYTQMEWTEELRIDSDFIKERKYKDAHNYELYQEYIQIYEYQYLPNENSCKLFIDPENGVDDWKQVSIETICDIETMMYDDKIDDYYYIDEYSLGMVREFIKTARKFKIYYSLFKNRVYAISNDLFHHSKVFGDDYANVFRDGYDGIGSFLRLRGCTRKKKQGVSVNTVYQHITPCIIICMRYEWLKYCLYGQDDQFNIFRSMCFVDTWNRKSVRFVTGIICLTLQIILTIGITIEVINNWDIEIMFDNDPIIVAIACLAFTLFSLVYYFTVSKYYAFYTNMHLIFEISWIIVIFDFISNVLIGLIICSISLFYLLQSGTISDVVLNSFALGFIIELDDMVNLFESDEDKLEEADWTHLSGEWGDYNHQMQKRVIKVLENFGFRSLFKTLIYICFSPFVLIGTVPIIIIRMYYYVKRRCNKDKIF